MTEKAPRCEGTGVQSVTGTVSVKDVDQDRWVHGTHTTCAACGHDVRFRVRQTDRWPYARVLPHRTDGSPCR